MRRLMLLMGLYLMVVQINRSGGSIIASALTRDPGYSPADVGAIMGSMFLASAAVQIPAGMLFDRFGPRVMLSSMNIVAVLGIAVFAVAGSVSGLIAGRVLIGIGHGAVIAGIYLLAVSWAAPERTASVAATVVALAGGSGALLATTPLSRALDNAGFGATFGVLALVTLAFSVGIYVVVRDAPPGSRDDAPRVAETLRQSLRGMWEVASDRKLWRIYAMGTCFTAPFMTVGGLWAGPYLRDVHDLDAAHVGYVLFAMMLAFHVGYLAYGPLDRVLNSRKRVVLGGVAGMIVTLLALSAAREAPLALVVALLIAFSGCAPFYITLAAHCRDFVPIQRVGRALACINLGGLVGVFIMQAGSGVLMESVAEESGSGYHLVFLTLAAVLTAAAVPYLGVRDAPVRAPSAASPRSDSGR